jgi:Flp pilus assembly protein TadG
MVCPAPGERGSATVELVLLAPALVLVIGFTVFAGRLGLAGMDVRHAAAAAVTAARAEATANLASSSVSCVDSGVDVTAVMDPASSVSVSVACPIALSDLTVFGLPGARVIRARAVEPVDVYRGSS